MLLKILSDFSQPGRNLINYFLGSPWNQREGRRKYLIKGHKPSGPTVITKINILKKPPDTVFEVMERESSVREHLEKQICEIQMNSLLADSALKDSGLLIDAELAEGGKKNFILKQFLPAQLNFAWLESRQGRCRAGAVLT